MLFKDVNLEKKSNKLIMRIGVFISMMCLYCSNMLYVAAATNYGENAGKWILDQLFWVAIAICGVVLIKEVLKRSYVGIISTVAIGAIVCFFIKNPTKFESIGNQLGKIIGF